MSEDFVKMFNNTTSRSTEKLAVLMAGLSNLSKEKTDKVSRIRLTWEEVGSFEDAVIVPNLDIEFYS